jgi:hypothetical protein
MRTTSRRVSSILNFWLPFVVGLVAAVLLVSLFPTVGRKWALISLTVGLGATVAFSYALTGVVGFVCGLLRMEPVEMTPLFRRGWQLAADRSATSRERGQ